MLSVDCIENFGRINKLFTKKIDTHDHEYNALCEHVRSDDSRNVTCRVCYGYWFVWYQKFVREAING